MKRRGGAGDPDLNLAFAGEVLRKAEGYGFDISLIAERFLGPDHECWMMAAALAPLTNSIRLMPAIHPGMITPQVVAKMGASLDRLSGGRCAINIVNGWWQQEFEMYSNGNWIEASDARYRRMNEFVQVMKGLWTEDEFSYDGEFYRLDKGSLPTKSATLPHPPLFAASRTDLGMDIIARECDVWFALVQQNFRNYEENYGVIADGIAEMRRRSANYGRKLGYGVSCHVICRDSMEEVLQAAEGLEREGQKSRLALVAAKALGAGLVGTPQIIADRIRRYEDAGVTMLMLHFHPMLDGLDTFAEKVMPLLGSSAPTFRQALAQEGAL
jgi:FMNH2-dependent dimethyl sulfone monooxygenase